MPPPLLVTDEPVDRWFSRPLARLVVPVLARTPITPNQVTGLASLVGVASGVALGWRSGVGFAVLTAVFVVLDCCDGQLARLRGGGGLLGRVIDGCGDYLTAVSIHIGLYLWIAGERGPVWALGLSIAAGLSMAWTAFLLDKYKRRYKGETDDPAELERQIGAHTGWRRALLVTMRPYTRRIAAEAPIPDLPAYQATVRLPLRLFLLVGHTSHVTVWSVFAVLDQPVTYAWIAIGPFTLLGLVGLLLQRGAERRLQPS